MPSSQWIAFCARVYNLVVRLRCLLILEDGQDLVEYVLIVALIALGATTSMKTLAAGLSVAFTRISTQLSSAVV
jgi:pilus assembly protein Flp/PilA